MLSLKIMLKSKLTSILGVKAKLNAKFNASFTFNDDFKANFTFNDDFKAMIKIEADSWVKFRFILELPILLGLIISCQLVQLGF